MPLSMDAQRFTITIIPTPPPGRDSCQASFGQILGGPLTEEQKKTPEHDCTNFVGGALFGDIDGNRDEHPVYMITPDKGNGNCLKAPKDKSPVLAMNKLPPKNPGDKATVLDVTCPNTGLRRRRDTLNRLERRDRCDLVSGYVPGINFGVCSNVCFLAVGSVFWG